ncbi:MAG: hypothetical protein IPK10_09220 [Bacteroidetes bacterium]|nr:hypothetical protein [Bacteroidota bacterium]
MKKFAGLYIELEQESRYSRRVDAIADYFHAVSRDDGAIALSILLGFKNKSIVKKEVLKQLACESAHIQSWMFEECLTHGNNYLDTVSMIVPSGASTQHFSLQESMSWLKTMSALHPDESIQRILIHWPTFSVEERIVFNQMLCGVFKFNVSFDELTEALSRCSRIQKGVVAIRLTQWKPLISSMDDLLTPIDYSEDGAMPESFKTRWEWTSELEGLLNPKNWCAKWLPDGIEVQFIRLNGEVFIWGANNKLFWNRFPELESFFLSVEDNIIVCGTLVGWSNKGVDKVILQKRESKKNITAKTVTDFPVRFIVSEVRRRFANSKESEIVNDEMLNRFLHQINNVDSLFIWNESIIFKSWEDLFAMQSRKRMRGSLGMEIFSISTNEIGVEQTKSYFRRNEPYSLNLILLYVKSGTYNGDKSSEEYTFGIRHESSFIPITRVSSFHNDDERAFIREFVKVNTLEKFGPVRNVNPELVFKISFASIYLNERKKSRVELVNVNVVCRLPHASINDAHQMQDLLNLLSKT